MSKEKDVEKPSSLIRAALDSGLSCKDDETEYCVPLSRLSIHENERKALWKYTNGGKKTAEKLEIEWVVDVADHNLNWFIATAFLYDDESRTIKVAIPDRIEPQWEGYLPLDHRCIHLMECCDPNSIALYKYIASLWTREVCWRVSWWNEDDTDEIAGIQRTGIAKFFGRITNALYVVPDRYVVASALMNKEVQRKKKNSKNTETYEKERGGTDFINDEAIEEVVVDEQLTLVEVLTPDGGHEDFEQLVVEGLVQWKQPNFQQEQQLNPNENPKALLEISLETLERLAADAAHCFHQALRDRCISQVEHGQVRDHLREFIVKGDLNAFENIANEAENEAHQHTAAIREKRRDANLALVSRCEKRFWQKAASGLLFRRCYKPGDKVLVLLCHGLNSVSGTITKVHSDDDSYDVDLQSAADSKTSNEIGLRIPPEYLRPFDNTGGNRQNEDEQKKRIHDLYEERRTLQKELEALECEHRQALEKAAEQQRVAAKKKNIKQATTLKAAATSNQTHLPTESTSDDYHHVDEVTQNDDHNQREEETDLNDDDDDHSQASSTPSAQQQPTKQRKPSITSKVSKGFKSIFNRKKK